MRVRREVAFGGSGKGFVLGGAGLPILKQRDEYHFTQTEKESTFWYLNLPQCFPIFLCHVLQ